MGRKKAHFPNFLGIGAARCGTTWLSNSLSSHPDVWIPRLKEIHYFTRSSKYLGPSQLQNGTVAQRLFSSAQPYRRYRRKLFRAIVSNIVRPSVGKLCWDANFLLRNPSDAWYASLFSQGFGKTTGEITPRYCILDAEDIERLKVLIPGVKIIFVMREPVDRAWSILKYHEKRWGQQLTCLPDAQLIERAMHPAILEQSDYESSLTRWRKVFPPEQLLTAFFDEIVENPQQLLARVCDFLQIAPMPSSAVVEGGRKKVNASSDRQMPEALKAVLVDRYAAMIKRLGDAEGGHFKRWFESYQPYRRVTFETTDRVEWRRSDSLKLGNRVSEGLRSAGPCGAG